MLSAIAPSVPNLSRSHSPHTVLAAAPFVGVIGPLGLGTSTPGPCADGARFLRYARGHETGIIRREVVLPEQTFPCYETFAPNGLRVVAASPTGMGNLAMASLTTGDNLSF
jgi:hypothetical protein